jgi:hypothetical protein
VSAPALDLFGMPVEPPPEVATGRCPAPPAKPAREPERAKAPAKPAPEAKRRLVPAPPPPAEPKVYEPVPMGRAPDAPPVKRAPELPRYRLALLREYGTCSCCGAQADSSAVIERAHHPEARILLCRACRSVGGQNAPARAEGALAGPWAVAWLREAGMIPYEPRRGTL